MDSNSLFILIVVIILFDFLLEKGLDWLNDRNWSKSIPDRVKDVFDEKKMETSFNYHQEKGRLGRISGGLSLVAVLLMLFLDGFAWVNELTGQVTDHKILHALLFFGVLGLASDIIGTPFSWYNTFVIEEKYGFNKMTSATFWLDKLKGYVMGGIMGGGLLALFIWFYQTMGANFWLYAWGLMVLFTIFMTMFYTSLILPLFNKLKPLEDGELRQSIEQFARKVGFGLTNIYEMDGSKRSTKANAFFSGLGSKKKIVLFDTLIEKHSVRELVAVLAHEIGHYKMKHTLVSVVLSIIQTGIMLFILSLMIDSPVLSSALGASESSFQLGLLAFSFLYAPISLILGLLMNGISRKNEFQADRYAGENYDAEPLQEALKRMSADHLTNLHPHPTYVFFHYSHPPLMDRLQALDKFKT